VFELRREIERSLADFLKDMPSEAQHARSSGNWPLDMARFHAHYDMHRVVDEMPPEILRELLKFRILSMREELQECEDAETAEDVVDAIIDLCVFAVGTLDLFAVDGNKGWQEVLVPNMNKRVGIKHSRPNPLGLPDLVKPDGWRGPSHTYNVGHLAKIFPTEASNED
jgi:Phosphoribosyl-ATP pyrophosphohydrolase